MEYQRLGGLKTVTHFREYLESLGLDLPVDDQLQSAADGSPLAQPLTIGGRTIGNRWAVHPMEGWDGTPDGLPSEHTLRRWHNFGQSGCKLIWGGEAVAVRHDGRANPNQLYYRPENVRGLEQLYQTLCDSHAARFGLDSTDDLYVGLQLTHSGRFSRPNRKDQLEPRIVYHHPLLDARTGIAPDDDAAVLTDDDIRLLVDDYVAAAKAAQQIGFDFVDVKHCHGYLGHEFLSAFDRPGPYGGDLENRTRFLREIIEGVQAQCPGLDIGVRLSVFDRMPYHRNPSSDPPGLGVPDPYEGLAYPGFGCRRDKPAEIALAEPVQLIEQLRDRYGVRLFNITCGSPYYNPHIQRPAFYPPSDGYLPPEDPLVGCVRQVRTVADLKRAVPDAVFVGSAYSYFQEFLPHVAQALVRQGWADVVGIGRIVLSDWNLPADILAGNLERSTKRTCRTFSDCTTAPRNGMISGCFPLDDYYKAMPEAMQVKRIKAQLRKG